MSAADVRHQQQAAATYIGSTAEVSVGGAAVLSAALVVEARYMALCVDTDIYIRQGGAGLVVTTADMLLPQGQAFYFNTDDTTNNRISVLSASNVGGALRLTRIDAVS